MSRSFSTDRRRDRVPGPLTVLTIGQSWPSVSPGGLNRYVADLHAALPGAGVEAAVLALGPLPEPVPGVQVCASEASALPVRLVSLLVAAWSHLGRSDLFVSHFALYGALPAVAARLRGVPVVVHFHGPWSAESRAQGESSRATWWKAKLERWVYRQAAALVVVSPAFKALLVEEFGIPADRITVITPGVDLERFNAQPGAATQARDTADFTAFTVRRLVPRMGLDVLVDAWPADPDAALVIAGDGPERAALTARAAGKNVTFLGRVSDEELRRWYSRADVVVVPSVALEGFGLVVLEALACGTPVLASRTGGLTEVLPLVGDDMLVPPGDVRAWADRLAAARTGGLPSAARCREVAERFGLDSFAEAAAELYRRVATGVLR